MTISILFAALVSAGAGSVSVDVHSGDTLHIVCPAGATSTIQLPEIGFLSVAAGGADRLGIKVESFQEMVLKVSPSVKPGAATRLAFKGAQSRNTLTIDLEAGAATVTAPNVQYRWTVALEPATPSSTAAPTATDDATGGTATVDAPETQAAAPAVSSEFRLDEFVLAAKPKEIGEKQGLPGHRICVLEDVIEGAQRSWYRFRMQAGAGLKLRAVHGPVGPIATFRSEAAGKDLRIVVQLDRAQLEKKHHLKLEFSDGSNYSFGLKNASLGSLIRKLL